MQTRISISALYGTLAESISGVRAVQSMSREGENSKRFDKLNQDNRNANIWAGIPQRRRHAGHRARRGDRDGRRAASSAASAPSTPTSSTSPRSSACSLPFTLYVTRFFDPIRDLVMQYTMFQRAMAGGERIFEVLDTHGAHQRQARRHRARRRRGPRRLRPRRLPLRRGRAGPPGRRPARQARRDDRLRRPHRRRQDDDHLAGQPRLRGHRRRHPHRRPRHPRHRAPLAHAPHGRRAAAALPVHRHRPREHRLRPPGRHAGDSSRRRPRPSARTTSSRGWSTATTRCCSSAARTSRSASASSSASPAPSSPQPRILVLDEATAYVDTQTEVIIQNALRRAAEGPHVVRHRPPPLDHPRGRPHRRARQRQRSSRSATTMSCWRTNGVYANLYRMTYEQEAGPARAERRSAKTWPRPAVAR